MLCCAEEWRIVGFLGLVFSRIAFGKPVYDTPRRELKVAEDDLETWFK